MASNLSTLFSAFLHGKYVLVSFQTWVIYETIITVDKSVELFWKQPCNSFKVLFFINRYVSILTTSIHTLQQFVTHPPVMVCYVALWIWFTGTMVLVLVVNLALLLRVNALWSHSRLVKRMAMVLSLINFLTYAISGTYLWAISSMAPQISPFTGCSAIPRSRLPLSILFIPSVVFETCVIILILIKTRPILGQTKGRLPLLTLLLKDGIAYYVIIILTQVLASPPVVVGPIACNRLFIRLQEALVGKQAITFEAATSTSIAVQVWVDTSCETSVDICPPPIAYRERDGRTRRPISTQWSDI
ncbi:hypothetical protein CPB86DRAFT_755591 [Serendipita vermifera]|nr:hypothetical protein CPB86DRAFT_755591 [Serendipita vermifera]